MNVKILLALLTLLVSSVVFVGLRFFLIPMQSYYFNCNSSINFVSGNSKSYLIQGDLQISAHIVQIKGRKSYVSESGTVYFKNERYTVNRRILLKFNDVTKDGFSEVTIEDINKNIGDTLPEFLSDILNEHQKIFLYRFENLGGGVWRWSDIKRTIMICKSEY